MSNSPRQLHIRGEKKGHITCGLKVLVCEDPTGRVWSTHDFLTDEDGRLCLKMKNQGVAQVAHGLLTEALRRQTFMSALAQLTADEDLLTTYRDADGDTRLQMEASLGAATQEVIWRTLGKMSANAAREVLTMMAAQVK